METRRPVEFDPAIHGEMPGELAMQAVRMAQVDLDDLSHEGLFQQRVAEQRAHQAADYADASQAFMPRVQELRDGLQEQQQDYVRLHLKVVDYQTQKKSHEADRDSCNQSIEGLQERNTVIERDRLNTKLEEGAYIEGKEVWTDIDGKLHKLSQAAIQAYHEPSVGRLPSSDQHRLQAKFDELSLGKRDVTAEIRNKTVECFQAEQAIRELDEKIEPLQANEAVVLQRIAAIEQQIDQQLAAIAQLRQAIAILGGDQVAAPVVAAEPAPTEAQPVTDPNRFADTIILSAADWGPSQVPDEVFAPAPIRADLFGSVGRSLLGRNVVLQPRT